MSRFRSGPASFPQPSIGDKLHVEGCHRNYRPKLIEIDGDIGVVSVHGSLMRWPLRRLVRAEDWDAKHKRSRKT